MRAGCDGLLVGSYKLRSPSTAVYVTPNFDAARQVIDAGADMIGIEATRQPLEDGATTYDLIRRIKAECERDTNGMDANGAVQRGNQVWA